LLFRKKDKPKSRSKSAWREWGEAIVIAIILAFFIRTFMVQAYKIPSGSMEPTLLVGDQVLVCKFWYGLRIPFTDVVLFSRLPKRGDIVVFKPPKREEDYIKRVIGLPGDVVQFRGGSQIWIKPAGDQKFRRFAFLEGPHVRHLKLPDEVYKVPPGKLFLMGDNRDNSSDSREWGFAEMKDVRGKAFMIYWSWFGWSNNDYVDWKDHTTYGVRWYRLNPFNGYLWIPGVRRRGPRIDSSFPPQECDQLKRRILARCREFTRGANQKCAPGASFDRVECTQARWRANRACEYARKMKQGEGFCPAKSAQAPARKKPMTPVKQPASGG
jgi:signal peptidase I